MHAPPRAFGSNPHDLPSFPAHVGEIIVQRADGGTVWWPVIAVGLAVVSLVIGYVAGHYAHLWLAEHFRHLYSPNPTERREKIFYLLMRAFLRSLTVVIQVAVAAVLVVGVAPDDIAWRSTMVMTILSVGIARIVMMVIEGIVAPDTPAHRMIALSDADAAGLYRGFGVAVWIAVPIGALCILMDMMGISRDAHVLMLVFATLLSAVLFSVLAIRFRSAVAGAILGGRTDGVSPAFRLFARTWHAIAVLYFFGAWIVSAVRLLLDKQGALGLILAPIINGIWALVAFAIAILIIERVFRGRETVALAEPSGVSETGGDDELAATSAGPVRQNALRDLAEHAVGLLILVTYAFFAVDDWFAVSASADETLAAAGELILVCFLAYIAFHAVKIKVDGFIAEEAGGGGDGIEVESGSEGGGAGATRLATLLPIFRNFLLAVIAVIAGMIVLSELGLDIAPLFAGAGVIGLAVGFGAQTLIRDIFSGAFFLMDDAFRKGEYIEVGGTRGTVEKISIRPCNCAINSARSTRSRSGRLLSLTNYSRDWVMMKLPLRLTYDTDPEKVRKLIKTLGKELLEHPEVGAKFIEPLKSQGVYQMEDSRDDRAGQVHDQTGRPVPGSKSGLRAHSRVVRGKWDPLCP